MESPTRAKLNFNIQISREEAEETRSEPSLGANDDDDDDASYPVVGPGDEEKGWLDFFNNEEHILGSVFYASGYLERTSQNGRLDWALIRPAAAGRGHRVGDNLLPTWDEWKEVGGYMRRRPSRSCSSILRSPPHQGVTTSIHNMTNGHVVYKVGASTRRTIGQFSAIKPSCVIKEERYMSERKRSQRSSDAGNDDDVDVESSEFMFMGVEDLAFARWGDSGSVVWNRNGYAVGLLFRGQAPNQSKGWFAYVTPIEDVFESIKAKSGGKIEEIRFLGEA